MAIAHKDEFVNSTNPGSTADPLDIVCAVTATPNGICVIIVQNGATTDQIASVVYGTGSPSVPLARAAGPGGFAVDNTEAGAVYIYWAGDSAIFPTGTQTLRINRSATTSAIGVVVSTMTCAAGQVVAYDSDATSGSVASGANPAWTHTTLAANVVAYEGIHSGLTTMTNTPRTSPVVWTLQNSLDVGAQGRGFARATFAGPGALSPGWTAATADDYVGCSIAFKEAAPPVAGLGPPWAHPRRRSAHRIRR